MKTLNKNNPPERRRAPAGLEILVRDIAALKLREVALAARLEAELQQARDRHAPELARLRREVERKLSEARAWAESHRAAFGERRSLELPHGVAGWRLGQPALRLASGQTWEGAAAALKRLPALAGYLRVREEVNKQALLADRAALDAALLKCAGLRIEQAEVFFVEPRLGAI